MKKNDHDNDELRPEYHREDLGAGVRGKYFESYQEGTNLGACPRITPARHSCEGRNPGFGIITGSRASPG